MVNTKELENKFIAEITGDIDNHSAAFIRKNIDDEYSKANANDIILDFKGVTFMDSSGIGLIMGRYKNLKPNGKIYISNVNSDIKRILKISGIQKIATLEEI
ncbi:MAG: anti-sigma factor antagonist [Defluviitaleaceae bacterium]|nr:anti-sigma factor antagonist [Defluviitaleaceae bacterium]